MRSGRGKRYERRVVMAHRQDEVPVVAPKSCSFASKGMPDDLLGGSDTVRDPRDLFSPGAHARFHAQ